MNSIGLKFFQSFKNLKSDAVPKPPRSTNNGLSNGNESQNSQSDTEEVFVEPNVEEPEDVMKKAKYKKPKIPKQKKNANGSSKKNTTEPSSPINTQATGGVINIMNSSHVHVGSTITFVYEGTGKGQDKANEKEEELVQMTDSIQLLLESKITPQHTHLDYISKNLGKNWHDFFKSLGYTSGQIQTMEIDEARNGVSEARYKLLLDWKRNDDDGTLGRLATLLWNNGERQIVKGLAIIYKSSV